MRRAVSDVMGEGGLKSRASSWTFPVLAVLLAAAALARVLAARGDLWFDEIWSWRLARAARSSLEVFSFHHDNNHIINTLYMYMLGPEAGFFSLRLLSVASGVALVALLTARAYGKGRLEGLIVCALSGLSYPLILYSSEARGYSTAALFSLLSFLAVERWAEKKEKWCLAAFWVCAVGGTFSHTSYIYVYLSLLLWSVALVFGEKGESFRHFVQLHAPPLAFLALYAVFHLRFIEVGGGDPAPLSEVLSKVLLMMTGLSGAAAVAGPAPLLIGGAALIAGALSLSRLWPRRQWVFFLSLFLVPTLLVLVLSPPFLYFRYFLLIFPFFYLLLGALLASMFRRRGILRGAAALLFALMLLSNIGLTVRLIDLGRGGYLEGVRVMAAETEGSVVVVGSDHDVRNYNLLDFYGAYLPPGKRLRYLSRDEWPAEGPEWMVFHSLDGYASPPDGLRDEAGRRYTLRRTLPHAGDSGWSWSIYRRIGSGGG